MEAFLIALDTIEMDSAFQNSIDSLLYKNTDLDLDLDVLREPITIEMLTIIYNSCHSDFASVEKCAFVLVRLYKKCRTILNDEEYEQALHRFHSDIEPFFIFSQVLHYHDSEIIYVLESQKHALRQINAWDKSEALCEIQRIIGYITKYYHYYSTTKEMVLGNDILLACIAFYQRLLGFGEPYVRLCFEHWRR